MQHDHASQWWPENINDYPLHRKVEWYLRAQLKQGVYGPHQPLPSSRELSETLHVSRSTIQTAIDRLVGEGLLFTRPRSGVFPVATRSPQIETHNGVVWDELLYRSSPPATSTLPVDYEQFPFPFLPGYSEPASFPDRSWLQAHSMALSGHHKSMSIRDPLLSDDPLLLDMIRTEILPARGISVPSSHILITTGAQQGLFMLAHALSGPGIDVGIEHPGYRDSYYLFAHTGASIHPVEVDKHGALFDQKNPYHIYYTTPSSQHPTAVMMSMSRRESLLHILRQNTSSIVIEDDYEADIRLEGIAPASLYSLDTTGRVIYLSTFSKYLSPGLRMGFLVADPQLLEQLRFFRHLLSKSPSPLLQRTLALFIQNGDYMRQIQRYKRQLRKKYDRFSEAVVEFMPEFYDQILTPKASMWLECSDSLDAMSWARRARGRGVLVVSGDTFAFPGIGSERKIGQRQGGDVESLSLNSLRLGLASIPLNRLKEGVRRLAESR